MNKRFFIIALMALSLVACTDGLQKSISELEDKYAELEGRVARLEELCKEMNTNISSLKTLVSVILNNDYIVSVTPIEKDGQEVGYVITFAIHEPITIYHGQKGQDGKDGVDGKDGEDGKDGVDGKDGKDGVTPIIGVALDTSDNAYYWTLNGDWMLDINGNRIPLTSRDGKDGEDGKDGKNGITPQLKIQDSYWYLSYDDGATWTKLGKAVGENGEDGKDGKNGDSMFSSVTYDENFVYFELANGTKLTINRYKDESVKVVDGAIMAEFSVSETKKVYFSQGTLLFSSEGEHLCIDGSTKAGTWKFADNQYTISNADFSSRFLWGTSGCDELQPSSYKDWGVYNAIKNGGNTPNVWRTLTKEEFEYFYTHHTKKKNAVIKVRNSSVEGMIICPDNWSFGDNFPSVYYADEQLFPDDYPEWKTLQEKGCIFLPIVKDSEPSWTAWISSAYYIYCGQYYELYIGNPTTNVARMVRLVKDVE